MSREKHPKQLQPLLGGGRHFWNSGMFMLRASVWLKAIGHFAPEILAACRQAVDGAQDDGDIVRFEDNCGRRER